MGSRWPRWDEWWWDWIEHHYDGRVDLLEDPRDDPNSLSFQRTIDPLDEGPPIESEWDRQAEDRIARGLEG